VRTGAVVPGDVPGDGVAGGSAVGPGMVVAVSAFRHCQGTGNAPGLGNCWFGPSQSGEFSADAAHGGGAADGQYSGSGERGYAVIRKAPWLLIPLALGLVIAAQRRDIARYLKIKQMSAGGGHPENIPAGGSQSYPQPGRGAHDGTGDFDSASRGGPARGQ